ncbi:uncharacterized protein LOC129907672 isoform X2 [Episyrphus balteatus]|uniref:uncharacterized protein LOC129907672 isoform X2 n=1 Tax=Episyrphus balteatus TaxID=286459 RepID=UPI00248592B5|nr:uncharacterized protein LOC129907672 isoform X2 [Episyrphus balteatus]
MNIKYQFLIIIIAILSQLGSASKFNVSLSQFEPCDMYNLRGALNRFEDYFEVSSMKQNLKKENERLHLKFYVMANHASNILLVEKNNFTWSDKNCGRAYKIVLGDPMHPSLILNNPVPGLTAFKREEKLTPYILPTSDPLPVEIIQTNHGELIVNIPGYAEPLMKYLDPHPVNIKSFSLGTFGEKPAKWFFNCHFDENSNKEAQNMCHCGVKNVSSIKSLAATKLKQEHCVKKQTNSKEKNNGDQLLLTSKLLSAIYSSITKLTLKLSAMDSRITNLPDYFLTDLVKKQTNYNEKHNEDHLLLTSKLSAMDSRITNLTDYFLTHLVKKQTNYNEKQNEDHLLLTSKLSAMDYRITNLTDYFLTDLVKKQTNYSEKYNEDQLLLTSKLSAMDSRITNLTDYFLTHLVKKQTNYNEKQNEDHLLLTSKLSAMNSRITNLTDYFLTDLVKKQTNYNEKHNEDNLLLTSKLSAMDSRITNLTDYFLTDLVKKQTNYSEKYNEEQLLLLASKLSVIESRITNLTDYFLSDCVETQTNSKEKNNEDQSLTSKLLSTDPNMIKLMEYFLSGTGPFNRHNSFFNGLVPTLNNFDDDQVIEFQQGVIEVMKKIKNGNTPTTTKKAIPKIDVRRGNGI